MYSNKKYYSDFLVIGSGIAGLTYAIKASTVGSVNIVTKKKDFDSNTNYAQGGIASVLSFDDSIESHINDTITAGAGLCNGKAVRVLVEGGPERIRELIDWGTRFSMESLRDGNYVPDLSREGGHSHNRIVHADDLTGREIERALLSKIASIDNIRIFEDHTAVDLLTEHQLKFLSHEGDQITKDSITCYGAYILENSTGHVHIFNSKVTLLACGGVGQVYLHTTNPEIATGDGITMAYRAGAIVADMEFFQFHPTALYVKKQKGRALLISEAIRGEGAILVNSRGEKFMDRLHPLKDLAPRDIVARAIDKELKRLGESCVYLDISFKSKEFLQKRFPNIYEHCLKEGIDISREAIPVVPAAHYLCGGIVSDINGRTSIRNLYVSGESACTGVHGANRLASNSLLEAVVFSHRAFIHSSKLLKSKSDNIKIPEYPYWSKEGTFDLEEWILIQHNIEEIKRLMWDYVGIVRSDLRLQRAHRRILLLNDEIVEYYKKSTLTSRLVELRNLSAVAKLIIESAIIRKESRGLHHNTSYPITKEELRSNIILRSGHKPETALVENIVFD
ncbi:MAG: L-aspartate oxidase [Spirochaetota bacterium]|nr:L-aspartate oxidase [Spirochaetota bacterium]